MTAFLKAGGVPPNDSVTSAMLKDNSITASKIPDGAVTVAKTTGLPGDKDIRALALELADVKGAAFNFPNGGADAFDSDTLATKTNATYDATNDYYHNPGGGEDLVSDDSTTWGSQAHTYSGGATTGLNPESINLASSTSNWWYAIDFGSGNAQDIIKGEGYYTSPNYDGTRSGAWEYSDDNTNWTSVATISGTYSSDPMLFTWSSAGAHRYWRMRIDSWVGSNVMAISKVRMYRSLVTANMTLINSGLTAASAPSSGFVTVQADPVSTITLNTDLTVEISRDGGTTFTAATLTAGSENGGFINYEGTCDISGQPSGTSMKYRVKTLNLKEVRVSGVVLRWS